MVHPRPLRRARRAPQPRFPADVTGEEQVSVSVHIVEVLGASSGDPLVDLVATFSRDDKQHVLMELPQARAANPAAALQMVNTREVDVVVAASLDDLPQVEIRSGAAGTDPADRVGDEGHGAPAAAGRPRPGGGRGPRSDHRPAGRVAERSSGARAG
jgi:hypothetical protein